MTTRSDVGELLLNARAATACAELRLVIDAILRTGADTLFQRRAFKPSDLVVPFASSPALWIVARGEAYMERRSSQGRGLRPHCVRAGGVFGAFPEGNQRPLPPPVDFYVRAVTAFEAAVLPESAFGALLAKCPEIARSLAFLDLRERVCEVAELRLRAFPGMTMLPVETIVGLIESGTRAEFAPGDTVVKQGELADHFYIVLEGGFRLVRDHHQQTIERSAAVGQLLGAPALIAEIPAVESAIAETNALCVAITQEQWRALLSASPMARRGAETLLPDDTVDLVLVHSDVPGAPLLELTTLLARALREDFEDDSFIVRLVRGDPPAGNDAVLETTDPHGVPTLTIYASTASVAIRVVRDALRRYAARAEFIGLLHPASDFREIHGQLLSRVAWLTRSAHTTPDGHLAGVPVARAGLLAPIGDAAAHPWPTRTVRLRLDFDLVRRLVNAEDPLATGAWRQDPTAQGLRRWGRALSDRLVGLALGGGGSPGFAHIALIRSLEARTPLEIDMVAGTSFGALVGAWYAGVRQLGIEEPARLQSMLDVGKQLNRCLTVGMLSTRPLAKLVDDTFRELRVSELEQPFFPVSSEVDSGTVYVGRAATLGVAVQMSGAFPPFFPPVIRGPHARLVDGGFVNNVPASVLRTEGASFVIASNSIGLIPPRPAKEGRVRRVMAALNPVGRVEDAVRAGMMLFHRIGDAQSLFADVTYDSQYTGFEFWNFNRGQDVIDQTQGAADALADRVARGIALSRTHKNTSIRAFGALA